MSGHPAGIPRAGRGAGGPGRGPGGHGPAGAVMGGEKPLHFGATMRRMLALMGQFKGRIALVLVFAIGSTVFSIVGPKVLSEATTVLFDGTVAAAAGTGSIDFDAIGRILLITLGLYVASAACAWVQSWVMSYVSQQTCYRLRDAIARKIERVPFGYFEKSSTGDTLSRITNDVDTLGQSLNQGVTQLITSVVTVVGVLAMMLSINWVMTLVALAMIPVSSALVVVVVRLSQKHFVAQQRLLGALNGQVEETFSGHAVVKAFGREGATVEAYERDNDALFNAGWKAQFLSGLMMPVLGFVGNLGYVAVAVSGAFFAVTGAITVGDIQAFIQYVKNFTQPITQLAQVSNVLQSLAAAAERIFAFLDLPEMDDAPATVDANGLASDVAFDSVRFGYSPDAPVIRDFSAQVAAGRTVAIVGPTGAGKTTMVKLLMRFYDVDAGAIRIGGVDIRDLTRAQVRGLFAMVLQDTWLFSGTIRENIRYGRLDATDEAVEAAAREACADHFIRTLPGGYDFVINEDASNISAGQRQLLTIARALLADRRMLILDEATSSVDTRTEARIQRAMDRLMEGRTSFVIAHRLSTIRRADLILVMCDGDIAEQGTHDELLAAGGFYADLYASQFAACNDRFEGEGRGTAEPPTLRHPPAIPTAR
ncbi:ABC transporter ATP-binding protein [Adlercreutzia mucosicola]|uniref:ABC transporter ATP-binding protein n=1 Tax=Adlercreutzia mucosicola TaxID=580026 RepID=UPI002B2438D1|nr:ABC transporter ATP-binding protein [Adlercreutzia mucosicola]MEB1813164.1 ABC transporter ATP-binding protein/permease [Adlercreutzia mucosicola]